MPDELTYDVYIKTVNVVDVFGDRVYEARVLGDALRELWEKASKTRSPKWIGHATLFVTPVSPSDNLVTDQLRTIGLKVPHAP